MMAVVKILLIVIICTFIGALLIGALFLIAIVLSRHEDEADYLEAFLDKCTPTEKNRALAQRELDMLRYKITPVRYGELEDKLKSTFG